MDKLQITLRLPMKLIGLLKKESERKGISINEIITLAIWNYFELWK